MDTLVTIQVADREDDPQKTAQREESVERAFEWFRRIEECCTRFDERSELRRLGTQVGIAVPASAILYEAVRFALAVAQESGGAFDPTVGRSMEARGFNREYRTGRIVASAAGRDEAASYRDIRLDPERKTITLLRPLVLDLGAVAKGLAVDMAAREVRTFGDFAINAGGDLYLGGSNPAGVAWSIGINHPRPDVDAGNNPGKQLIGSIRVSDRAVCTSGDYERRAPAASTNGETNGHHIVDPRAGESARTAVSATVVAPSAMLADALATAAFVLGPVDGIKLIERLGVDGLIISPTLERFATQGMYSDYQFSDSAILPDAQGPSSYHPGDPARPSHAH